MSQRPILTFFVGLFLVLLGVAMSSRMFGVEPGPADRGRAEKLFRDGNWKEAYELFRQLVLDSKSDPTKVSDDLNKGVQCLNQLGRIKEFDDLVEGAIKTHGTHWRVLQTAAQQYQTVDKNGLIIAGKFERGPHRGGGKPAQSIDRDRVRALQLFQQAMPLAMQDDLKHEVAAFLLNFAQAFRSHHYGDGFTLHVLTNLSELPDYQEGYGGWNPSNGAAVDENGEPIFHRVPQSWEAARSDGERWRWLLEQTVEVSPSLRPSVQWQLADFLWQQFDVQTLNEGGWFRPQLPDKEGDGNKNESGTYALHTLGESETIARLATGVRRFPLPDEFNFIKLLQEMAAEPKSGFAENALQRLAEIFENRRQYPRAAGYWQENIKLFGAGNEKWKQQRLEQITANWGRFETVSTQPAGQGATVEFTFRNATAVSFTAQSIDISKLLGDVKAYLKGSPRDLDWNKLQIDNIGWRLVTENEKRYLGEEVASWKQKLEPRDKHFDRRITITTPLRDAGAYLITARVADGNESKIVLWVDDTAILHKRLNNANLYFVADATTGRPIASANVEFFGWRQEAVRNNRPRILTTNFAEKTDAQGQVVPENRDLTQQYQWLITARAPQGRLAYLGFRGVWTGSYHDQEYNAVKVFAITDRPVYRPEQKVQFKFWVRHAQYDNNKSDFARHEFLVELRDPKGEKIREWKVQADEYGGLEGSWDIPSSATLGAYHLVVQNHGGGSFRVEEYKKPEYEVSIDAPTEPVMLGEKITAKISAKYYFGSPVTNATVKYKVLRHEHQHTWYPIAPWDWCFGKGYWWFSYDYTWYPGWERWAGCVRPLPWWLPFNRQPPEVVAEREVPIGEDGTVSVEIDTALAKELHGDTDHRYTITAEVRDQSRRTIVGEGNVLVARRPFKVFTWVDRGYFRTGDTIQAQFRAATIDNRPVKGTGEVRLLRIGYKDLKDGKASQGGSVEPVETEVQKWKLDTNEEGVAHLQIEAAAAGQYRLSYQLTDAKEHTIEGAYIFTIIGPGFDGHEFKFNHLELIPDQREYGPGETVKLQINTDRPNSTVLLFVRPANGIYLPPKTLRLTGKSTLEEIVIAKKDMPNFFIEAVTISDGQVHSETKEIVVPPEKRVLNVEVLPNQTEYKPGQKAKVKVHLTDFSGENFMGSTVMAIYDKSVEYISGGSNVPDIKEFFWKWRRHHQPQHDSSLERYSGNMTLPNKPSMNPIGVFGGSVADEMEELTISRSNRRGKSQAMTMRARGAGGFMGGMGGGLADGFAAAAPAMAGLPGSAAEGNALSFDAAPSESGEAPLVSPTIRSNFADTAFWAGKLETNSDGVAEVSLDMPENLTTWKIKVWGMGHGTQVGSGEAEVVTRKNLIVRLQAPRFFVQKDEVVLSANLHNYLATEKRVTAVLELDGGLLKALGETTVQITVPANGEKRVDWRVAVVDEGQATVRMKGLTDEESDAMEMKFPCYVHGQLKTESWAGTVRPDKDRASVTIRVPAERRPEQSVLEVRYSPTLAAAMVDALPYLADYPYGCTEQTLNRFLPTVITQKILLGMNLNLSEIRDKRTNLNAQEIGDDRDRTRQWKRFDRNPVFDREELDRMVKDGLTALTNMQCSDGGWGWFSGFGERSWPHTTAVVVHGLQIARDNDVAIVPGVLENGIEWLKRYQADQIQRIKNAPARRREWKDRADDLDALVYMILVDAGAENAEMRDFLYRDRKDLTVYSKAMFGLALHRVGDKEKLAMVRQNLEQFLVQDTENETAYLQMPEGNYWWYWHGSDIEANAYYLKLLARVEPQGVVAPRLVKYLLNNRKHSTYWNSTRDTAVCVEAFADYLLGSGEAQPNMVVEVWFDGEKKKEVQISGENLFSFDNKFVLAGEDLPDGQHVVELRRRGEGPIYFNAYLTNFTLEDPITKAGLEVKVERKFYRLVPVDKQVQVEGTRGQPIRQKVEKYRREPLANLAQLTSGELVEVELEIESKNDYEYLIFEDMKAAGFEAVDLRSGYTNNGLGAYTEFRDNRVTFFIRQLARGRHSISYRLRAETPGRFSALPAHAAGMYAPELRGNSDEIKLQIKD